MGSRIIVRILAGLGIAAVVLGAALLVFLRWSGAWGVVFPSRAYDSTAPALPAELTRPAILLFTKTNSFRHVEAIEASTPLFHELADRLGATLFHTESGAVFAPELLARFDAVVFANASGDMLSDEQDAAFAAWLEAGGGWLGVHAAGDGSHADWRWYVENLIGADYVAHIMDPQFQTARIVIEDRGHPATRGLPEQWSHEEEWYSWESSPRDAGFHVLATVDETTYRPHFSLFGQEMDLRMGDHPILWTNCVGKGRTIYSALGHQAAAYATPEYRTLLEGALAWAAGLRGESCD
jgi:type 1 glutamine amidotransferase